MRFARHASRSLLALLLLPLALLVPLGPAHAAQVEPVILVHGWYGSASNMTDLATALNQAGYRAYTINLPGQENVANARAIGDLVTKARNETGAAKVSLVGHSMGGLSTRHYIKFMGGTNTVRAYVSMGTGQHGYQPACSLGEWFGGQMCPTNKFILDLNAGDQTPGDVAYTTLYSTKDEAKEPLVGAWCSREIPDVNHADEPKSPLFIDATKKALSGVCP
ncbi:esterase/lipase family protein [Spirillospora sp. CA-294931]|uniref:esterase/lipase family protein n=1 Tax=Spirillospora sp. CA-294931 TaxID=3240042 RepID=UPI003D936C86